VQVLNSPNYKDYKVIKGHSIMPPKNKYKTKGVELKIDFGSGSNPEVVTPVRQV